MEENVNVNETEIRLNKFINQKSISQNFLNVAILQNQISILITTLKKSSYSGSDNALITLILLNISLQGIIFFCITIIDHIKPSHKNSKILNTVVTLLSGVILMVNITITVMTGT